MVLYRCQTGNNCSRSSQVISFVTILSKNKVFVKEHVSQKIEETWGVEQGSVRLQSV